MSIVVGFGPDTKSSSGVRLAAQLARTTGDDLTLCCVVYDAFASPALRDFSGVDDDWRAGLESMAAAALIEARAALPPGMGVAEVLRPGRSVPQALQEEGERLRARLLVVGSSTQGVFGRIGLGSTSDRLVHSSEVPVALAPRGYQPGESGVRRIVFAVSPTPSDVALARDVAELARWLGCGVEIVTFVTRSAAPTAFATFSDQGVIRQWQELVREAQAKVSDAVTAELPAAAVGRSDLVSGERWSQAINSFGWEAGDLLVVGSSQQGALSRVFLGSTAARILRHSPVPVVLMPRGLRPGLAGGGADDA